MTSVTVLIKSDKFKNGFWNLRMNKMEVYFNQKQGFGLGPAKFNTE